ncbi:SCO2322 family protein [Peterkaempfera sp. SMS 1(5)a]|uniref:SCO2322 family protein n=1 Tax=Peterkaempfera podocarpi TaxID=3232308 RepID=UPI00366DD774
MTTPSRTQVPAAGARRVPSGRRALPLAVLLGALLLLTAAPAHATGYRYWSFWDWSHGSWSYQQQGPATYRPEDGDVDGWRFAVSPDGGADAARPRTTGDFASVCAATPPRAGRKRIAVVLDFGTTADSATGEQPPARRTLCAVVPTDASSAEVLAATVPPLRYDSSAVLCAIAGYPSSGCGEVVAAAPAGHPSASAKSSGNGGPVLGLAGGGAVVVLIAVGAAVRARRTRNR